MNIYDRLTALNITLPPASTPAAVASAPQPSAQSSAPAVTAPVPVAAAPAATPSTTPAAAVATPTPAAPTTRAIAPAPAADNTATSSSPQARILALPANQFTLQVLGASSRANVEQFVQRHSGSSLLWYETRNNGNPWFVVIQGSYASREAARSALAGLPAELRDQQPWVRSLEEVHAEIRARN